MSLRLAALALLTSAHVVAAQAPTLVVEHGTTAAGEATAAWAAVLRRRLGNAAAEQWVRLERPLDPAERAWAALIESRAPAWESEIAAVAAPFAPLIPPGRVTIVLGNRGASDAFTHDARTIGFDVAALQEAYGDAAAAGNAARLDRFFRHEYTHVMQKAWWAAHPYDMGSPLRAALAEMWAEGLGNYHSLSGRWRAADGRPSEAAARARAELEPRVVARLAALACAPAERAAALTADLSSGRFDRKWGALVPALWIAAEPRPDSAYRALVQAGPEGIRTLAARHLPPALASLLEEIRVADSLCRS